MTNNFKNCFLFLQISCTCNTLYKSRNRKACTYQKDAGLSIFYDENIIVKIYNQLSEPHCQHESYPGYFP